MQHTLKILLLSGGLDSTTLLYDAVAESVPVHALLVHYKSRHNDFELSCAKLHCRRLHVNYTTIELPDLGGLNEQSWIVPARNQILLSLACNLAVQMGATEVLIGCNREDEAGFPDCRQAFIQIFNTMLTTAEIPVEVIAPYLHWPKSKIAAHAQVLGVKPNSIWTCYAPTEEGTPCGTCPACVKLSQALPVPGIKCVICGKPAEPKSTQCRKHKYGK